MPNNVNSFFREPEVCKYLKSTLLPRLLKSKNAEQALRIWVPVCSTGEDAFSLAMLILEIQDSKCRDIPVQIFATDPEAQLINEARMAVYSKAQVENITPKRLQRFFTRTASGYRIAQVVRESCIFATHHLLTDPPFSHIDLVSARNWLVAPNTQDQKKTLATFHYALNPEGYLQVSTTGTIGNAARLFAPANKKMKIYFRKKGLSPQLERTPLKSVSRATTRSADAINELLLSHFVPASVVINRQLDIVQFRGLTSPYLTYPPGKATLKVFKMVRPEIGVELRKAVTEAFSTGQPLQLQDIYLYEDAKNITVDVMPVSTGRNGVLLLIVFKEQQGPGKSLKSNSRHNNRNRQQQVEIAACRDELQLMSEEHAAALEEYQSANEEVVSTNEELRSLNEELEASKAVIESASESLARINRELQTRNELLDESYQYAEAIIATIHEPMLILDRQFRVKTANNAFYKKFEADQVHTEGMLFFDLGNQQWDIPVLRTQLADTLKNNQPFYELEIEQYFPGVGKKILHLNAKPILQPMHGEQFISLAIYDVTQEVMTRLKIEEAVRARTEELFQANEALAEKNNMLKKVNQELEAFAYVSSHDLQEPLRKIQTFANWITKKEAAKLSEKGKYYFGRMILASAQMQTLIEDLLAFARINVSKFTVETVELSPIIASVIAGLKETIVEKKANIEVKADCKARIIPFQFQQLMYNLLSNALKFAHPDRPPEIRIGTGIATGKEWKVTGLLPRKEYCHTSITDNGIGFEQEFGEQIFEVFQRLHNKEDYPGTGIGLAIAKKIVENHNGVITATGVLDKGARFDIYLPA